MKIFIERSDNMNIKEVALRAGVSIATVSRVINNTTPVSEEVRKRVEDIINETGYRPNSLAKELQNNKTNTIGVIMSVSVLAITSLGNTINAITDELKGKGYSIMLANSRFDSKDELDFFKVFQEKRVDGILYFAVNFTEDHYQLLKKYPVPIVMIGQENEYLDFPCVLHDNYHAAKHITEHLIHMGHERIAYIGLPDYDAAAGKERRKGFEAAMRLNNLQIYPEYLADGDFSIDSGYSCMKSILGASEIKPTAIFAATDFMALGAMHYLTEMKYNIPDDFSIVGFDDVDVAAYLNPPLTTIRSDNVAVGRQAAKLLLQILDKKDPDIKKFIANYELKNRESVKNIKI
jgi:LacI family sucrose operon transcriptional repressor